MNGKKILVIDDQRSQLRLIKNLLTKLGHTAVTVDSAEEAGLILRWEQDFSMIITDLKMPWLDGLEFCKNAKSSHPNLKIFALSGFIGGYDPLELKTAGFDGIFQKPVREMLLRKIIAASQTDSPAKSQTT
ncbi:MAG: response regulator [Desulfobacterales bacterium]|nr:response regulator [Desulfobacterales bacterium]